MTNRTELHELVDELPEDDIEEAVLLLRRLKDPVMRMFDEAPEEDEELSPEGKVALDEGLQAIARGEVISHREAMRELGL